jgi:hypothetical protein
MTRRSHGFILRAGTALTVGALGGWAGGAVGQFLFDRLHYGVFLVFGWSLTGLLIGAAPAASDLLAVWLRGMDAGGAQRKVRNGVLGGAFGGLLGGGLDLILMSVGPHLFPGRETDRLWTPSAAGFVALGACIGFAVGLAQVILKEAWLRVDVGFRAGRQLILSRPETTIGRSEACDLGLFGDPGVERVHARILRQRGSFVVADAGTPGGTYRNDQLVKGTAVLRSGDRIRVGATILSFGEQARKPGR